MGLVWKPHQFRLWSLVPEIVGGVLVRSEWDSGALMSGLLVEKTPKFVMDELGIEGKNPAVVLMDLDDCDLISVGDRLELDGVFYRVVVDPQRFEMGLATDHGRLIVERLDG